MRNKLLYCAAGGAAIGAMLLASPDANATPSSYLYALGAAGYSGPDVTYLTIGEWVCDRQGIYTDYEMATAIVANTGVGIYMPEGYEIIRIARSELCNGPGYLT